MDRQRIAVDSFSVRPSSAWEEGWFLLTAGENRPGAFNMMTVGMGSFGNMWNRPIAQIMVRPTRYTNEFLERGEDFTLCAFSQDFRKALAYCGSHSGRDVNKVEGSGLTPIPSTAVSAPGFEEAELIVECRKIYYDRIKPEHFLADYMEPCYPDKDYHAVYCGEILAMHGTAKYAC